jgi:hypothetical protein
VHAFASHDCTIASDECAKPAFAVRPWHAPPQRSAVPKTCSAGFGDDVAAMRLDWACGFDASLRCAAARCRLPRFRQRASSHAGNDAPAQSCFAAQATRGGRHLNGIETLENAAAEPRPHPACGRGVVEPHALRIEYKAMIYLDKTDLRDFPPSNAPTPEFAYS